MKAIEELTLPVRDNTKNYILRLEEEGREQGREDQRKITIQKLIKSGGTIEYICDLMEVSPEYVDQIRRNMVE